MTRSTFQRMPEDKRRAELLNATLTVVANHGLHAASARKIAEQAGISAGLIRHYFASKDDMVRAAYAHLIATMTDEAARHVEAGSGSATARLAAFIVANLSGPNVSGFKVSLWATFIGVVRSDPAFAQIHRDGYKEFLEILTTLVTSVLTELNREAPPRDIARYAIALNGLIDGLWLEGSIDHGLYDPGDLAEIGLTSAECLLRLSENTLTCHLATLCTKGNDNAIR